MVEQKNKTTLNVIWAENDPDQYTYIIDKLSSAGVHLVVARSGQATIDKFVELHPQVALVILDIMMPKGDLSRKIKELIGDPASNKYKTVSRLRTGHAVAQCIRTLSEEVPILGVSSVRDPEVIEWFDEFGTGYVQKPCSNRHIYSRIMKTLGMKVETSCFIVHGHDEQTLSELRAFLEKHFGFDRIVVLQEEPERGQTIIEKFEAEATRSDIAFVLLTPDDPNGRPRQNVVFEAGYFLAKYGRKQGRCVLLKKGNVELPSDLAGMLPIDISRGCEHKKNQIEKEIKDWI